MSLSVLESVPLLSLRDEAVVIAGDSHGNLNWPARALPIAAGTGAQTMLHVGDFGFWPGRGALFLVAVDGWAQTTRQPDSPTGIERILVTPGNHDDWSQLDQVFAQAPGHAIRVSEVVWALPRNFRLTIGGRSFLSFGGAASVDVAYRVPDQEWWAGEMPTPEDVERAVAGGHADVLIAHDLGELSTPKVRRIVEGPSSWDQSALDYAAVSRNRITDVVAGTTPLVQFGGHYHVRDTGLHEREGLPPLRVEVLAMENDPGNLVHLDVASLAVTDVMVPR